MTGPRLITAAAFASLALAACSNPDNRGHAAAGNRLCTPFPEAAANASAANTAPGLQAPAQVDAAGALDDCLHRWGYSLAASGDKADLVAQATLAACTPALSRWNQQSLTTGAAATPQEPAPSLATGQMTTPLQEHLSYAQSRALFYVVQARAGKCAPPQSLNPTAPAR